MTGIQEIKAKVKRAIDSRREWMISASKEVLLCPETGFQEYRTAKFVGQKLEELGIRHEKNIALTGLKGYLKGNLGSPTVAIISELDALRVPGHPYADVTTDAAHACGHHCQIGMMLGVICGLSIPEVKDALSGDVAFVVVPAEEFIDVEYRWNLYKEGKLGLMSGKQEFIRLGAFDDIDMAMMVHTSSSQDDLKFSLGGTSNGHVVKYINFIGKASHAGGSPHHGVNALQAAMVSLNAINAQRETMRDQDTIRLHGILTRGGASVNSVPADVRYEGRVRGRNSEAIEDANIKMDRSIKAGALALGCKVNIITIPGYMPIINDETLMELFKGNASDIVGMSNVAVYSNSRNGGGSTDMGDLSQIMPVIHPYTRAARGAGHSIDYLIDDYDQAVVTPAKSLAMTVVDLLYDGAVKAKEITQKRRSNMTKEQYLQHQDQNLTEEMYEGK